MLWAYQQISDLHVPAATRNELRNLAMLRHDRRVAHQTFRMQMHDWSREVNVMEPGPSRTPPPTGPPSSSSPRPPVDLNELNRRSFEAAAVAGARRRAAAQAVGASGKARQVSKSLLRKSSLSASPQVPSGSVDARKPAATRLLPYRKAAADTGLENKDTSRDRICIILFEEIYLVGRLEVSKSKYIVQDFENYGNHSRTNLVADHALVFLVQGVHVGFNVVATVSDQDLTNRGAVSLLKSSSPPQDHVIYSIYGHNLVHVYDVPHLFKSSRSNLLSTNLRSLGSNSKLTMKHVNPVGKQKMRVKYAAQAISASISSLMESYIRLKWSQQF
ncbi:hypothetical protein FOCC_FOCC013952 [Frankliniella occidentalis]|nr:hypothetical protein FOCC_FOCC013952 [Frankliniella occidentalis]